MGAAPALAATPPALVAGMILADRYELIEKMGSGGFGDVWRARHVLLGVDVAVKVLNAAASRNADVLAIEERFRFEAQVSALISKTTRHVIAVHDAGVCAVGPYLAMELVVGRSLESILDNEGPLSPKALAKILAALGEALDASHQAGIVHRDLKPSNVLLGAEPEAMVKLIDFGIAKATSDVGAIERPKETGAGFLVGTPEYMSPEQLRKGEAITGAADLWALGVLAYEALTGLMPFGGATAAATMLRISERGFTTPSRARDGLPAALDLWFLRALAKDPGARYASGREAAEAFARLIAAPAPPAEPRRSGAIEAPPISIFAPPNRPARGSWLVTGAALGIAVAATIVAISAPRSAKAAMAAPGIRSVVVAMSARVASSEHPSEETPVRALSPGDLPSAELPVTRAAPERIPTRAAPPSASTRAAPPGDQSSVF